MFIGMSDTSLDWTTPDLDDGPAADASGSNAIDSGSDGGAEDGTDDGGHDASANTSPSRGRSKSSSSSSRGQRALVKRVAAKAVQIAAVKAPQRAILAAILGVENDTVSLTVAAITTSSEAAVNDLFALADADPMEAGLMAAELGADKARMKAVWGLLSALDAVTGEPASQSAKAGLAIARAAQALDKNTRSDITAALGLMK